MINLENILAASEAEIASAKKSTKAQRLQNLVKEGDVYRCLSSQKVEGEFLLSATGIEDQAVTIEWVEGICYVSGLNSTYATIFSASIQKDESALLRALHDKLSALKAGEEILKDPFFIVGPPGTGKTKTIVQIVEEAIARGKRVLVVSPTNMAVENVFERLDFDAMGLALGEALLTVNIENDTLRKYAPKAVAQIKLKPINDELEILEAAIAEMNKQKRDADALYNSVQSAEEALSITLTNLVRDEVELKNRLKGANSTINETEDRLAMIHSNTFISRVDPRFLSAKLAEIEAEKTIALNSASEAQKALDDLVEKKSTLIKKRSAALEELKEANEVLSRAEASRKSIEDRIKELKRQKDEVLDLNLFGTAKLVGATLVASALNKKINEGEFDLIVVDEASMASLPALILSTKAVKKSAIEPEVVSECKEYEGLYAAQAEAVNRSLQSQFVFVGDPKQLSPIAKTKEMRKGIFEVYGIEKLFKGESIDNAILLDINYRNHPDIVSLCSRLFYGGMLKSGREHTGKKALFIRNIKGSCTSYEGSYVNHASANAVFEQTSLALERGRRSIGVITPYRKQAENIHSRMNELMDIYPDADMQSGTIHRFQGKEKGVVLFDVTASSGQMLPATYCGDIDSEAARLLNVATTRAEDFFVLVGDIEGLQKQLSTLEKHEDLVIWQWIAGIKELAYS